MANPERVREQFEMLYVEWEERIKDPKMRMSSRPQDYTDLESYRQIVKLGSDALPLILEKIESGIFLMNQAALEIAGTKMDDVVAKETVLPAEKRADFATEKMPLFLSEQQKSQLILRHLHPT